MGYESKIYIVNKSGWSWEEDDKVYAETIASIDMSKAYELSDILRYKPATDCYIYADDGNTKILEDCYGKPLTETPLEEALKIVKDIVLKDPHGYWRYRILLATLQSVYNCMEGYDENIVVLHYGY